MWKRKSQAGMQSRESAMDSKLIRIQEDEAEAPISIWKEALFAADLLLLHASPVYYGLALPAAITQE